MSHSRDLRILMGVALFQGLVFYSPVATLYRLNFGLSLADIFAIEACSWALTFVLEIPSGWIADHWGPRRLLKLGYGLLFATKIVFALAEDWNGFLAERLLLAVAAASISGADDTVTAQETTESERPKIFAQLHSLGLAGMAVAAMASTQLVHFDLRWSAWATVIPYGIAWALSLGLSVDPRAKLTAQRKHRWRPLGLAWGRVFGQPRRWLFAAAIIAALEVIHNLTVFLSQALYLREQIPEAFWGLLFLTLQLAPILALRLVPTGWGRNSAKTMLLLVLASAFAMAALMGGRGPIVVVGSLVLSSLCQALLGPVFQTWKLSSFRASGRALTLSIYAWWAEIVAFLVNGAWSQSSHALETSLQTGLLILGGASVALAVLGRR